MTEWTEREIKIRRDVLVAADRERQSKGGHFFSQDLMDLANFILYLSAEVVFDQDIPASEAPRMAATLAKAIKDLSYVMGGAHPRPILFMALMALLKSECIDFFACAPEEDFGEFMKRVREGLALWGDRVKQPESPTSDSLM